MSLWRWLRLGLLFGAFFLFQPSDSLSLSGGTLDRRSCLQIGPAAVFSSLLAAPGAGNARVMTRPYLTEEYYNEGVTAASAGRSFFPTLTPPFRNRATYRYELGRNTWALEQLLTFANVTATIRTNVVLLQDKTLWVHSPQWPTGEFRQLLDELGYPVRHVVLPCNALEHKAPMKAFTKSYPEASVWISPGQYGPFGSCGMDLSQCEMGYRVDGIFASTTSNSDTKPSWADEFEMATLYADLPENAGPVSEVAFCHLPTKTLIATDAVVFIPSEAPAIFGTYFDAPAVQKPTFWPRTVLQSVFLPLRSESASDDDGTVVYPAYQALENRLVRAPILRAFADARGPDMVRAWVETIARFPFDRILTSHFASPIAASPTDFVNAFAYLKSNNGEAMDTLPPIACRDWELLEGLNQAIETNKLGAPVVYDYRQGCVP